MFMLLTIVETPIFEKMWPKYWTEEEREAFDIFIAANPEEGAVIPKANGLRKVRWSMKEKGKSGGVRVIYYNQVAKGQISLLIMHSKSEEAVIKPADLIKISKLMNLM